MFQKLCYTKWSWLTLCVTRYKLFCFYCRFIESINKLDLSKRKEPAFLTTGFDNYKKAVTKFNEHEPSDSQREALEKYQLINQKAKSVTSQLLKQIRQSQNKRQQMFLVELSSLKFLLRQGLAIRGHTEKEGNLKQLMLLRSQDVKWLLHSKNYLSPIIVNECIELFGRAVILKLLSHIQNSKYFAIIGDESRDISNKEQLSICIRWVDENCDVHEDFLGLYKLEQLDADSLTKTVKDVLLRFSLSQENCRGQAYDGAANMTGHLRGLAAQLKEKSNAAISVHCFAHCLNLCLQDCTRQCTLVRDSLSFVSEVANMIKNAPKKFTVFDKIRQQMSFDNNDGGPIKNLKPLCPTRWAVCSSVFEALLEKTNYKSVINAMAEIGELASGTLQTKALFLTEALKCVTVTKQYLQRLRETLFNQFYKKVKSEADDLEVSEPSIPRTRKQPRWLNSGSGPHIFTNVSDYFRQKFYVVDLLIGELDLRFQQPSVKNAINMETLLLNSANLESETIEIDPSLSKMYRDIDWTRLTWQLHMLPELIKQSKSNKVKPITKITTISTLVEIFAENDASKMFDEVSKVLRVFFTIPVSTATAERSFSSLRRLKTYLRSTMNQKRLNSTILSHIHKDILEEVGINTVYKEFVQANDERQRYFGKPKSLFHVLRT
nr:zinc finger MYM-type protein 1-like [Hydra vulgaris]